MGKLEKLTNASVTSVIDNKISITEHREAIELKEGMNVLIISSKSNFLRVIPLPKGTTFQIRVAMELDSFTITARELYEKVKELDLRALHSTGFCPLDDVCLWEGYFHSNETSNIDKFTEWLRSNNSVRDIEVIPLQE